MQTKLFLQIIAPLVFLSIFLSGCAAFRGIPGHGGGKRFDEEQLAVAAAITHAVKKMNFSGIGKRKVAYEVTSLETSGSGSVTHAGLGEIVPLGQYRKIKQDESSAIDPNIITNTSPTGRLVDTGYYQTDRLGELEPTVQMMPSYKTQKTITSSDIDYLKKVLEMRLRHDGFQVVDPEMADTQVIVLIDSLGTNVSRKDYGVGMQDKLGALCVITYYTVDPNTQKVLSASRGVASKSHYYERNIRLTPYSAHRRDVKDFRGSLVGMYENRGRQRSGKYLKTSGTREPTKYEKLNDLYQKADEFLDAEDRKGAAKTIRQIKKIDPNYSQLPDLIERLREVQ